MRAVTQADADAAKKAFKEGGEPVMVRLSSPLSGKWFVPLVDIEIIDGKQFHIIMDSQIRARLHHTYAVYMLEEGEELPPTPAPVVTLRPQDKPKAEKEKAPAKPREPKTERVVTDMERNYGSSSKTCICGCGSPTQSTFAPGHDAKMKSLLKKVQNNEAAITDVPAAVLDHVRDNAKWNGWYGNVLPS